MMFNFKKIFGKITEFMVLMTLTALILFLAGLYVLISPFYGKLTCTSETIAEVVYLSRHINDFKSGNETYAPTFSYNVNGEQITVQHNVYLSQNPYEIGDTLTIFYNPNKPEIFYIGGIKFINILMGLSFIGAAIVFFKLKNKFDF